MHAQRTGVQLMSCTKSEAVSEELALIERYTRPAMGRIWTEENKYRCWLQVESAASTVLAEDGVIPAAAAEAIATKASVSAARVAEIEAEVKHDVIAFTTAVAESLKSQGLDAESRWLHYGLTSNDIVDTAQALQVKEASALIRKGLAALLAVLKRRAIEFKHTPTIGRTHGIHAEPTTFGLKLLNWYAEMERNLARFDAAAEDMRVGKLSGAVGTFGHLSQSTRKRSASAWASSPRRWPRRSSSATGTLPTSRRWRSSAARSTRLPSRCATCSAPRCARRRSTSAKSKKAPRPCRTRRIPSPASRSAGWRACCAAMRRRRSKTFRCGTSAIFRIRRSSA